MGRDIESLVREGLGRVILSESVDCGSTITGFAVFESPPGPPGTNLEGSGGEAWPATGACYSI